MITPPANPELFEKAVLAYNAKLLTTLDWLTKAYGIAQHLTDKNDQGRLIKFPGVYTGTGKMYQNLLPDESLGNFAWWDFEPYQVQPVDNQLEVLTADFGLVLWFNINKVLNADEKRNLDNIISQVLTFFRQARVPSARVKCYQVTPRNQDIYKGFNLQEVEQQHLMHPFGGLRFNGKMTFERLCQ